ncbi:response regulator [Saccharospirillum impatiens]|jgi:CheY-like chemotaxis protein|uniref:response regulator n=1 Tax=Saccharospirillum impatiens TaxID=169438 RepID=UPI00041EFF3E|nr:response regulator [Saccharospirillum impatiens]
MASINWLDEKTRNGEEPPNTGWQVLVVDDEPEVHAVTRLALRRFTFEDRPLVVHTASSGHEALAIARELGEDLAMAIIDVVMETDRAGLDLVKAIREEVGNHLTRLVLRTGQPGSAPETDVVRDYDINDYKEKTELTAQKFHTMMYGGLRNYRDLRLMQGAVSAKTH